MFKEKFIVFITNSCRNIFIYVYNQFIYLEPLDLTHDIVKDLTLFVANSNPNTSHPNHIP